MEFLTNVWSIVLVALGLGLVVFIHELGHFLLAKRAGVKVETFSIGFGPVLFGIKRGETRYVISALPLGGYVMMLGEDGTTEGEKSTDPRAFQNKPVGARMAIISAGVIMNVILGLACFVFAYKWGMNYTPAIVGSVLPGSPAYEAGVKSGERIVRVDGHEALSFRDLVAASAVTDKGEKVTIELEDPTTKARRTLVIAPKVGKSDMFPMIGVTPTHGLTIALDESLGRISPGLDRPIEGLRSGDLIVAAGVEGKPLLPVRAFPEFQAIESAHPSETLMIDVERKAGKGKVDRASIQLPPNHIVALGLRMTIGPIASIRAGSPAEKAGFKKGDRIVAVEGNRDFDPTLLPLLCRERAGETTSFEVERLGDDGKAKTTVALGATADSSFPWNSYSNTLIDVPGLGLCYPVDPIVAGVEPNSPAAKAGLKKGDLVSMITLAGPKNAKGEPIASLLNSKSRDLVVSSGDDPKKLNWVGVFYDLQSFSIDLATLTVQGRSASINLVPERRPKQFNPIRGLQVDLLALPMPPQSMPTAIRLGLQDTRGSILSIFYSIRGLVTGRVSTKSMVGPIGIFGVGRESVEEGLSTFIHMLGLLSINLAVINFLPIPPLDGGRFLFLSAEKVRGRPLPESVLNGFQFAGMLFVFGLMLFVIFQDIKVRVWH